MGSKKLSSSRKRLIVGLSVAGGVVLVAGVTVPVVLTQLSKNNVTTNTPPEQVEDVSKDETQNIQVRYGTLLSGLKPPAKDGYEQPTIEESRTTYVPISPVGAKNLVAAFVYTSKNVSEPRLAVIYGVTIVKPADIIEDLSENSSVSYQVVYGTPLASFSPPPAREKYGPPEVDPTQTTYRVDQQELTAKIAFKYLANDPNAADLIAIYGVRLTKRANIERDGAPLSVAYGTKISSLPLPPAETGYKAPVLKEDRTSYSPTSAIGTAGLKAVFYYEPENSLNSDLFVTSSVTVAKAAAIESQVTATVRYGTKPETVAKPTQSRGYAAPVLQNSTTYREDSPVGATGLIVVWLMANNNTSAADRVVIVTVTITKQEDLIENTTAAAFFGSDPETVGKPSARSGYAPPAIDASKTTYAADSPIGTPGLAVVWKFTNNNPGKSDIYVRVAVTVNRPVDVYEDSTASVPYETDPTTIGKPAARTGYAEPVLDQSKTTYGPTTEAGLSGLVVWKLENLMPQAPDLYVRITVSVSKQVDITESDAATVAYGSNPQTIKKPAPRPGYGEPVVYNPLTTYRTDSPVGQTGLLVVWKLTNNNHSLSDVFVQVSVTIVKQSDRTETWSGNVPYGTAVDSTGKPAARDNYDGPVLVPAQTTYNATKALGPGGYVTWKFTSQNPGVADVYYRYIVTVVARSDAEEQTSASVPFGTPADQVGTPGVRSGYESPVVDPDQTTYTASTPVGTGTYVVWKLANTVDGAGDVYVKVAVTVTAQSDSIENDTASVKYGTLPDSIGKPAPRNGYGAPVIDSSLTTYTATTPVSNTNSIVAWRLASNNAGAADIVVKVAVSVQKQDDIAATATSVVTYGTSPSNVGKPQNRSGYAEPVLQTSQTTYTATTTVSMTDKVVVWRLANNNASAADVVVTVAVTVQKQKDVVESKDANAKYGTAPNMVGKPAGRPGYAAPVLDGTQTTYTASTAAGTTGTLVFWKFVNSNSSASDIYVKVAVSVQKQDDIIYAAAANAKYGTDPNTIGKPAKRTNYAAPVLDTARTTYTTSTAAGTAGTFVVWKLANNDSSAADIYVKVAVTVQKQDDFAEHTATTVTYGTNPSSVGKPQNRTGYTPPVLQTARTTYTATTAVGTNGKVVVWKMANSNASAADVVVTVAVTVSAQPDKTEDSSATVKYGTEPSNVGKPVPRNGYGAPALDTASTTYTATTPAGTTGKYVYWRLTNNTSGAGDVVVRVAVTIEKKDDVTQQTSVTVFYGTDPAEVGKPQNQNGYASPVPQTDQTTYTATTAVGISGKVVVWKLVNGNTSAADLVVTVAVTVKKQEDVVQNTTANAKYGTSADTIGKPADKPGYASPVLDSNQTTYTTSTAVGTAGALVVWKLVNNDHSAADVYVKVTVTVQKQDDVFESTTADAKYGTAPNTVGKPANRRGYAPPVLDAAKTTYTNSTPVGTAGALVVWKFANDDASASDIYVKVTVTVQKQDDLAEPSAANVAYGTNPSNVGKPQDRDGYVSAVLQTNQTTYTATTAVGTSGKVVVWRLANSNAGAADVVVTVAVTVQKQADVTQTTTADAKYGTKPDAIGKPAHRQGYAEPALDSALTTYSATTAVGTARTFVVWKLANDNNSAADIYVKVAVTVQKQDDVIETTTANAKYGTEPDAIGKPSVRPNYAAPVLDAAKTTYAKDTAVGTAGTFVVWKLVNDNSSAADIYVKVAVTVQKQDDVAENTATTVTYGTDPANVGKPQNRSGYGEPVLQTAQTTYTATTAVNTTGRVVVWKLVNSNASAADVFVTVAVTVAAKPDTTEDTSAAVKYGTAPSNVGKPSPRNGYAAPALDTASTTYSATTPAGTTGKYVYWRLANSTSGAGDVVVKVAVTVQKLDDVDEPSAATVAYGTEPDNVGKPQDRTGYASPVLLTGKTTYSETTAAGTTGKVVAWKLANNDASAADIVVTVAVTVQKQADKTETKTATAKYGAEPKTVGVPSNRTGYAAPVLDSVQTTYTNSTAVGTTGTLVVWKFANDNTSAADVYVKVTVTVQKQDDTTETATTTIDVIVGTSLSGLPTPPVKTGYGDPTVVPGSTTYSTGSAVGADANVVYRYPNDNVSKGDLLFTQPVRVIAEPQAFVLQRTEILNSIPTNGAPTYDLNQVTLDAKNEFSGAPNYWYKGVQQTTWSFPAGVPDGETITVSYPIAAKQGTTGAQGKLEVNYVVAVNKAPIFVYPVQKRMDNDTLPVAPTLPSGYALASTSWYLDNNSVDPAAAVSAPLNTRLQVVYKYSKANAVDVYVTKVLYTTNDHSKTTSGKYQIPYGLQPVFTPLIENTGTSWSQISASVTTAVATTADNYNGEFALNSAPLIENLNTAPARTTYNATLSNGNDSFVATIDVLAVQIAFTPPSETTTTTYRINEMPANYRPALPAPMVYGSVSARVTDTTAPTPGFFFRFETLANLAQLAAAPPGTTIVVTYSIDRPNSNYSYNGPLSFRLTFASVANPSLNANPLHVVYGYELSTVGLPGSPDPTKYTNSPSYDANLTTYDTTFKPGQQNLYAVLVYPSVIPGGDPLYVVQAVQVDKRPTVKTDQALDDYELYTKGSPAPVIDEHSFTLPEGIVIDGLPTYRNLADNKVIDASVIPTLPAGSRFVAEYFAHPAKYYDGIDIRVSITYYVNQPNPTSYVVAPIIYYGSQQTVNLPNTAGNVARTVLYGKDGTFKETMNVFASDPAVTEYWIRIDDYDDSAKSTRIQLIYVSKANENVTTKPEAPTLNIAKGATVHPSGGSIITSFKIKTAGPMSGGYAAGSAEADKPTNGAPGGTVYELVYSTSGTTDTVALKILPAVYYGNPSSPAVDKGDLVEGRLPDQTSQSLGKPPSNFGNYLYQTYKITKQATGDVGYYTTGTTFDIPALITNAPVGTVFERTYRAYALRPDEGATDIYRTGSYDTYTETYKIIAFKSV